MAEEDVVSINLKDSSIELKTVSTFRSGEILHMAFLMSSSSGSPSWEMFINFTDPMTYLITPCMVGDIVTGEGVGTLPVLTQPHKTWVLMVSPGKLVLKCNGRTMLRYELPASCAADISAMVEYVKFVKLPEISGPASYRQIRKSKIIFPF